MAAINNNENKIQQGSAESKETATCFMDMWNW